jgi:hypothetical protein
MDMSVIIIVAALVSILANLLKVWEFVSPRFGPHIKKLTRVAHLYNKGTTQTPPPPLRINVFDTINMGLNDG